MDIIWVCKYTYILIYLTKSFYGPAHRRILLDIYVYMYVYIHILYPYTNISNIICTNSRTKDELIANSRTKDELILISPLVGPEQLNNPNKVR